MLIEHLKLLPMKDITVGRKFVDKYADEKYPVVIVADGEAYFLGEREPIPKHLLLYNKTPRENGIYQLSRHICNPKTSECRIGEPADKCWMVERKAMYTGFSYKCAVWGFNKLEVKYSDRGSVLLKS